MKIWKWLLLTVTALVSYAFALMFPFEGELPGIETAAPTAIVVSLTPSAEPFTPTATQTAAPEPTVTATPQPTFTATPTPVLAPTLVVQYRQQPGTPAYIQMFRQPELGCNWMGVAGQVFDVEGQPISGIVVVVTGAIGEQQVDLVGVSGAVPAYGPGGYELQLSAKPLATSGTLAMTLYDLDGVPLIEPLLFDTKSSCSQNLVLINFQEQ
jgi:hypothetical protein